MQEMQEATQAIAVEHLVKRYPRMQHNAVDDISFTVRRGETFGLLGPNGAGKTTMIGILTTSVLPSGGRATITGIDVVADPVGVKQRIAVVPQRNNLDRSLRVGEILTYHAAYHGVPRAERTARAATLLEELGLNARRKEKLGWLSGGLEQRVMLARALMHEPEVLFLDEPTNNLDPQSRLLQSRLMAVYVKLDADRSSERFIHEKNIVQAFWEVKHILLAGSYFSSPRLGPGVSKMEVTDEYYDRRKYHGSYARWRQTRHRCLSSGTGRALARPGDTPAVQ